MSKYSSRILWVASSLLLIACGGGGGGGGGGSTTAQANAGSDQVVSRSGQVILDGTGSTDSSGAALGYVWRQVRGTDVTGGGVGTLTGASPSFSAPDNVETVSFELSVNGSSTDTVHINALEQNNSAFFVDGDSGDDTTGDGSMENPYASISHAIDQINNSDTDIYVRRLDGTRYQETANTLTLPAGASLYGGYGVDWVRDAANKPTGVHGFAEAVHFDDVTADAWISGFDLTTEDSANGSSRVSGISVDSGSARLVIEDNIIMTGNVGSGSGNPTASSIALRLASVDGLSVLRNTIISGLGGQGANGTQPGAANDGGNGSNGGTPGGGNGGTAGNPNGQGNEGGDGGDGGTSNGQNGTRGENGSSLANATGGGNGGTGGGGGSSTNIGGSGSGGVGGFGGGGGAGGNGVGSISGNGLYVASNGNNGQSGNSAAGGGGGGGGEAGVTTADGGGGGGGGGGGRAGSGGSGGRGGGASIGILLSGIADSIVSGNTITSSTGGDGGNGGFSGHSGNGGNGGSAGNGPNTGEDGGRGGGGGKGGMGGMGGGGGGGSSYAILVGINMTPQITNNMLTSGQGGSSGSGGSGGLFGSFGFAGGNGSTLYQSTRAGSGSSSVGGLSYGIFDLDPNDGFVPSVIGNSITVGSPGASGNSGEQNF